MRRPTAARCFAASSRAVRRRDRGAAARRRWSRGVPPWCGAEMILRRRGAARRRVVARRARRAHARRRGRSPSARRRCCAQGCAKPAARRRRGRDVSRRSWRRRRGGAPPTGRRRAARATAGARGGWCSPARGACLLPALEPLLAGSARARANRRAPRCPRRRSRVRRHLGGSPRARWRAPTCRQRAALRRAAVRSSWRRARRRGAGAPRVVALDGWVGVQLDLAAEQRRARGCQADAAPPGAAAWHDARRAPADDDPTASRRDSPPPTATTRSTPRGYAQPSCARRCTVPARRHRRPVRLHEVSDASPRAQPDDARAAARERVAVEVALRRRRLARRWVRVARARRCRR